MRTWAAVIGITAFGPALLALSIGCLITGELPTRYSAITASESPLLFYPIALALVGCTAVAAFYSLMFAIGYYRGRTSGK